MVITEAMKVLGEEFAKYEKKVEKLESQLEAERSWTTHLAEELEKTKDALTRRRIDAKRMFRSAMLLIDAGAGVDRGGILTEQQELLLHTFDLIIRDFDPESGKAIEDKNRFRNWNINS